MTKGSLEGLAEYLREGGDMLGENEDRKWFYDCADWVQAQADKMNK